LFQPGILLAQGAVAAVLQQAGDAGVQHVHALVPERVLQGAQRGQDRLPHAPVKGLPARPFDRIFVQFQAVVLHVDAQQGGLLRLQHQVVGFGRVGVVERAVIRLPVHRSS
jgi:hypothetical protein